MTGWLRSRRIVFATVVSLLLTTGCPSVMSSPSDNPAEHSSASNKFPLRFKIHSFGVHCYNTIRCLVVYNNFDFGSQAPSEHPSPAPPSSDYRDYWGMASYAGVPNFPPPAKVRWTSLDGAAHEAKVDIGAIFKDERVLYKIPDSEIPDGMYPQGLIMDAGILLEVNDRTVSVYMKALVGTKTEQIPGNKYSHGRADVIRAWTHTY
jgi:hypothetical protein